MTVNHAEKDQRKSRPCDQVLVLGGAGYIGSHMVRLLLDEGYEVVVVDNLSTGHREAVGDATLIEADIADKEKLRSIFARHDFQTVFHFAAKSIVSESARNPLMYYRNNVEGTLNLLDCMAKHGVQKMIFSSTAAVYGAPEKMPINEREPVRPVNPYGQTKAMVETILADMVEANGISSVALRYFNAAGAHESGLIGESHEPETHLIPNVIRSALLGSPPLSVYGNDYDTPDGTCVRDYIHVQDLAKAHMSALTWLENNRGSWLFNLGNETGYSVLEVIEMVENVIGRSIPYTVGVRRAGDPETLVADASRARDMLGWRPAHSSLENIIRTAVAWHSKFSY